MTKIMPQWEATNLLCAAVRTLGMDKLREMLPAPFVLHQVNDHDTGRHVYMAAKTDDLPWVHVWGGSVWHSSRYLFNDEVHPPGIQKDCEWATEPLARYFERVKEAHTKAKQAQDEARETAKRNAADQARVVAARYAEIAASAA